MTRSSSKRAKSEQKEEKRLVTEVIKWTEQLMLTESGVAQVVAKQKREIRRQRLRSISKHHPYLIPLTSPLQIKKIVKFCQLHWKAELYPTQRSSLDKTADFLQTKFPLWSLQRNKCQKSSLAWQTWLEHEWGKAPYPVSFHVLFVFK